MLMMKKTNYKIKKLLKCKIFKFYSPNLIAQNLPALVK